MKVDAEALLGLPAGTRRRPELQPLIYVVLEREDRLGALSAAERATARRSYYWSLGRSVAVRDTLALCVDEAAAAGVVVLPLKGALLASAVYPDAAARPMADLDIAVEPAGAEALASRLVARGYSRYGVGQRRFDLDHTHHLILTHAHAPLIELHVRLLHELGADGRLDGFFARAITLPLLGRELRIPSWEDHAFYVALHAAAHGFADSPLWLFDLAYLMPRVADSSCIAAAARTRRGVAAIHFAFTLAARYFPSLALPVDEPRGRAVRAAVLHALLGSDPLATRPTQLKSLLLRFALTDRVGDIGRALVGKTALRAAERFLEK